MIQGIIDNQMIIKDMNGEKFAVPLDKCVVHIPSRDGTGGTRLAWFDMNELMKNNKVNPRTTADEASGALKLIGDWPDCPEKSLAISTIKQYLDSKRDERRDETIIIMTSLYGPELALKLSKGVREHAFSFPCYFLKESAFAKIVVGFIDNYRGCVSAASYAPKTKQAAIQVCQMFGGSKCRCWLAQALQITKLAEDRIRPIFETVKYLETTR